MHSLHNLVYKSKVILLFLCLLFNAAIQPPTLAVGASEDVRTVSPCELEAMLNQLVNPSSEYQLHASALRNLLKIALEDRQLPLDDEQSLFAGYPADRASEVLSSVTLNGVSSLPDSSDYVPDSSDNADSVDMSEQKRNIGTLARDGAINNGKRNVGTLARDFQLPNGKRQSPPHTHREQPKRNLAAVARYNSQNHRGGAASEKRNLGALKGSPVHGAQQKRNNEEMLSAGESDYAEPMAVPVQGYWLYPSYAGYADLDWGDYQRAEKRFLGRVLPPTRATASTNRSRL